MLGAEPDRERLRLDRPAARREQLEQLARAVSGREHEPVGLERAPVREPQPARSARPRSVEVDRPRAPHERAAAALQLLAHRRDRRGQDVRADVRLALRPRCAPTFPKRANSSTTLRTAGWWMRVPSLPSVYAPAPPSPKFMFDSGSSAPPRMSVATSRRRGLTGLPRSTTMDGTPRSSSAHAQKSPAGPAPRMMGGAPACARASGRRLGRGRQPRRPSGAPRISPSTSTSTFTSQRAWPFRRASSERRTTVASRRCSAERPSRSAARRVRSDSSSSSQSGMFEIR